jgi:hypothetical protein
VNEFDKFVVNEYIKLLERMNSVEDLEQERLRVAWALSSRKEILKEKMETV